MLRCHGLGLGSRSALLVRPRGRPTLQTLSAIKKKAAKQVCIDACPPVQVYTPTRSPALRARSFSRLLSVDRSHHGPRSSIRRPASAGKSTSIRFPSPLIKTSRLVLNSLACTGTPRLAHSLTCSFARSFASPLTFGKIRRIPCSISTRSMSPTWLLLTTTIRTR